ncbi:MAG TPA: sigma-54 dependent transcriptional regulator [Polyangiaceae bacterium]|nr:sigma-54 dependent transcriptional regulator [Polyangiaceae bacterium]
MSALVLIVDGEATRAASIAAALAAHRLSAKVVPVADAAARDAGADVAILRDEGGSEAELRAVLGGFPEIPVVIVGVGDGGPALRAGAADFLSAEASPEELCRAVTRLLAVEDPAPEPKVTTDSGLLGTSKAMAAVLDVVRRVAIGNATVLVRGESGTGKELVARKIHAGSPRASGPFVKVHCAGIPESLLESELFGYERGAFTGATTRKPGRVELAEGGTLFLDEIGDVSAAVQVKLLRLLQDREYERLGGTQTLRADVRFVAATHRDLEHMTKKGEFREDLFYRLNVVPVWLPPLRARREDVPLLAERFCETFGRAHGKPNAKLTPGAVTALSAERWPGNVRQLQNFVERLVVLSEHGMVTEADVTRELAPPPTYQTAKNEPEAPPVATIGTLAGTVVPLDTAVRAAEKGAIERALRHAKGNRAVAARLLGIGRATLYKKLAEHGIGE